MNCPIKKLMPNKWKENYAHTIEGMQAMRQDHQKYYKHVSARYIESKNLWLVKFRRPR